MSETVDINFFDQSDQVKPNVGVSLRDTTPPDWSDYDTTNDSQSADEATNWSICDEPDPTCNDPTIATVAPDQSDVACNMKKFVATCNNQKILPTCNNQEEKFLNCNSQGLIDDATVAVEEKEEKNEWITITKKKVNNATKRSNLKLHLKYYGEIGNLKEMLSLSGVTNPMIRKHKDSLVIRSTYYSCPPLNKL